MYTYCARKRGADLGEKRKNRTLLHAERRANFYVSLTTSLSLAAAGKRYRETESGLFATEISPVMTGILGVFPTCTCRRRYMYISEARKSLIVNTAKRGYAQGAYPLFPTHKDNTFSPYFQIAVNFIYIINAGKIEHFFGLFSNTYRAEKPCPCPPRHAAFGSTTRSGFRTDKFTLHA